MNLAGFAPSGVGRSVIGPDDLLEISVISGLDEKETKPHLLRVAASGAVAVPYIGEVQVGGCEATEAGRRISAAAVQRSVLRQPQVTVAVKEKATNEVIVLGAVAEPGPYELPRTGCDVVSAIAAAGGLTDEADANVEVLRREAPTTLASVAAGTGGVQPASFQEQPGSTAGDVIQRISLVDPNRLSSEQRRLGDRDVVMVRPRDKEVIHVSGLVRKPDQFELPDGEDIRLLDALAMAGGRTSPLADRAIVIRQPNPDGEPAVISVSVAAAKKSGVDNLLLAPGDLISVESTFATTVADAAKSFFRVSLGLSRNLASF